MMEKEDLIRDTKQGILFNGLYRSAKVLVKTFRNSNMNDDEFILRMRTLLDEWEKFKEKAREEE